MKHILLIATGGTIASVENESGLAPNLTGEQLAQCVPELQEVADYEVIQLMNIDSTNMGPQEWLCIKDCITTHYDAFDGFVVMHGTDTMSYTAAALSYLIQDSPKPIVLTGSQKPMGNPFTDAKLNLYQSMVYAVDDASSNACIVFDGRVICGTRARKQRTMSHNAFTSINFPDIAMVRNNRVLRPSVVIKKGGQPKVFDKLCDRVCAIKLTPGLKPNILQALKQDYDAVIIETFGVGGIPEFSHDTTTFKEAIYDWVATGHTAVLTTQVPEEGCDMGVYQVGYAYQNHPGILLGEDMTTEALLAKTMWALGNASDPEELKHLFYTPINFDRSGV